MLSAGHAGLRDLSPWLLSGARAIDEFPPAGHTATSQTGVQSGETLSSQSERHMRQGSQRQARCSVASPLGAVVGVDYTFERCLLNPGRGAGGAGGWRGDSCGGRGEIVPEAAALRTTCRFREPRCSPTHHVQLITAI
ncbi:hypothetical protein AAFF_G00035320 [Aldrovandia affinis]|uniref:Uncharacterized protein n=1 Tax=Aldrovandia affinis TaxID=143900 RepID=A0AAD7S5C5_9TELE|nr:hypothetical protein AAFF_G00035320 [Aldrovandia affinis]